MTTVNNVYNQAHAERLWWSAIEEEADRRGVEIDELMNLMFDGLPSMENRYYARAQIVTAEENGKFWTVRFDDGSTMALHDVDFELLFRPVQ